jgi:hypothetical protein
VRERISPPAIAGGAAIFGFRAGPCRTPDPPRLRSIPHPKAVAARVDAGARRRFLTAFRQISARFSSVSGHIRSTVIWAFPQLINALGVIVL